VVTDLATRYGTPRPTRRPFVVTGVALVAAAFLGWLLWAMLFHGRPLAQSDMVRFEVAGQHAAEATFTVVRRTSDVEASCLLRATAADHSIVGELNVAVGPGGPETQTLTRTLRTEREATSVDLVGCVADGQPQRR
jgi:hypothetical protein